MYFLFVITILMNADRKPRSLFIYQINSRFHILYFGISGSFSCEHLIFFPGHNNLITFILQFFFHLF